MSSKKGGLLFGVVVGTLVGVLFAPKKGKDLRSQLKTEMEKGGMGTKTMKSSFTEMGKDIGSTAEMIYQQPEVQKQIKKGKKQVDVFLKDSMKYIDKAEEEMKKIGEKYGINREKIDQAREHIEGGIQMVKNRIMGEAKNIKKVLKKSPQKTVKKAVGKTVKKATKKVTSKKTIKKSK